MRLDIYQNQPEIDWKLNYDPKLVGKYLLWHEADLAKRYPKGIITHSGERVIIMNTEPSLEGFLKWLATPKKGNNADQ